jgi:alkaline phosphatase D
LIGTSISSSPVVPLSAEPLVAKLPDIRYLNIRQRGWTRCEVTSQGWTAEFRVTDDPASVAAPLHTDATFVIRPDQVGAQRQ